MQPHPAGSAVLFSRLFPVSPFHTFGDKSARQPCLAGSYELSPRDMGHVRGMCAV